MTTTAIPSKPPLRASHRKVLQLFRLYGSQTDAEGWAISPSGLRSRRAELTPPRGRGIRDSGTTRKSQFNTKSTVWELDPEVTEPFAHRREGP